MVNRAFCDLLGYEADTLLQMTWRDVRAPNDFDDGLTAIVDIIMGRQDSQRSIHQYIRADGQRLWGDLTISCLRDADGNVEHFIGQIVDVTEQVELRAKQAEADARFRRLMETSNVAMAFVAPGGRFDMVNQALCELFGYDEATMKTKTWREMTPARYLEADLKNVEDLFAGRLDEYRVIKQHIHADGHLFWVDLSVSCLRDPDGEVQYMVAQGVDVTDEVEARELLAKREKENRVLADRLQAELRDAADYVGRSFPGTCPGALGFRPATCPHSTSGAIASTTDGSTTTTSACT